MMIYLLVLCVCSLFIKQSQCYYTQQWVLHVDGGSDVADAVARDHGFVNLGEIFEDYYHFQHRKVAKRSVRSHAGKKALLAADTRVRWAQQQKAKKRVKRDLRLQDSDPRWPSMWYLNRGNGLDMNVIPAWLEGITGKGAVVTILDDGLEKDHPDLVQNYDPMASYDVNNQDPDPSPRYDMIDSNRHGTRCAGEVAATSNNSVCALGVAHGAQVGGVRMLDGDVTDAVEARSLSLNPQHIDIYSASWGPDDDGKTVDGPGELATRAFIEGVTKGRNGKGSIFIWASGNGGRDHDNCNCDGYTNSIYSLSISSATEQGHVPWYSEACSSTLASTYSSGAVGEKQVVTTDLHHSCTSSHTGTSASAPLAAGICALALEANPKLTWRDMQHIVVRTARPQNLIARDWQTNGVGRNVSHSFGYGLMDAYAMVQLARTWETVPEQHKCEITASHGEKQIPAKSVVVLNLQVTECEGVQVLEHVQAKLTIYSHRRGDLNIQLTSPIGTRVTLLAHRPHDMTRAGFSNWPFMSVHSWGESPIGIWQLEIHNDGRFLGRATLQSWSLILYGTRSFSPVEKSPLGKGKAASTTSKAAKKKSNKKQKGGLGGGGNKAGAKPSVPPTSVAKQIVLSSNKSQNKQSKNKITASPYKKKNQKPESSFFYAVNSSKFRNGADRDYFKLFKNFTITYPVMIPSLDNVKSREPTSFRKAQKQKEKSRDLNSNINSKLYPSTTPPTTTKMTATETFPTKLGSNDSAVEFRSWDLILYGTATPPVADSTTTSFNKPTVPQEVPNNSVDDDTPPLKTWSGDAEIRKDTSEVEEDLPQVNAISGCEKSNGRLCIECEDGLFVFEGKCVDKCPERYYPSTLETKIKDTAEEIGSTKKVCLSCHYTCRICSGSNDYQCTECYPDAILTNPKESESYCYPLSMRVKIEDEKWYFRIFMLLTFFFVIFFILLVLWYIRYRKDMSYRFTGIDSSDEKIREMERKVRTAIYSDSE
ncbi:proprotein convertase subtilisin/kexin type 4-like isoform X1 [Onthophagus taurus]|uniref:proprotein convertase subtilisin/kexin type 4-like isoform X1 n=1 Tax=Onthophagus taurus TaxID=166361 RepID=UPI000C203118|nr:furin-like protease 1 isoform X1 [Onthophagus taurus]